MESRVQTRYDPSRLLRYALADSFQACAFLLMNGLFHGLVINPRYVSRVVVVWVCGLGIFWFLEFFCQHHFERLLA